MTLVHMSRKGPYWTAVLSGAAVVVVASARLQVKGPHGSMLYFRFVLLLTWPSLALWNLKNAGESMETSSAITSNLKEGKAFGHWELSQQSLTEQPLCSRSYTMYSGQNTEQNSVWKQENLASNLAYHFQLCGSGRVTSLSESWFSLTTKWDNHRPHRVAGRRWNTGCYLMFKSEI